MTVGKDPGDDELHNLLNNKSIVEPCTFTDADYKGDLTPNEVFTLGLKAMGSTYDDLEKWILGDDEVLDVKQSEIKVHVYTRRGEYVFNYHTHGGPEGPEYGFTGHHVILVCNVTEYEFQVDIMNVPEKIRDTAEDKLHELTEQELR